MDDSHPDRSGHSDPVEVREEQAPIAPHLRRRASSLRRIRFQSSARSGFTVYMNNGGSDYYDPNPDYGQFPVVPCVSDMTIDEDAVTISGVAESNIGIKQIEFSNDTMGTNGIANGTENWSAPIGLNEGDNK